MRVLSYMHQAHELIPVDVELSLVPGLPQFIFLGLPDAAIRESAVRIRAALRAQGFKIPKGKKVLVQLRPNHLRKSSRGLDLAIAAAFLWETQQIAKPEEAVPCLYGELTLDGHVMMPDDLEEFLCNDAIYTGASERALIFPSYRIQSLGDLREPAVRTPGFSQKIWQRPLPKVAAFPEKAARLATIVAAGEHSTLVAGPQGTGKTTFVDTIPAWLESPKEISVRNWRPVSKPHHSSTSTAILGGDQPGEITRANGGVLILDELLEFDRSVQEALREPVEAGRISVVRGRIARTYPAKFLMLATTNLCSCGRYSPVGPSANPCRCSSRMKKKVFERLNGPFADRFAILSYSSTWNGKQVPTSNILDEAKKAVAFRQDAREQDVPNSELSGEDLKRSLSTLQLSLVEELSKHSIRRSESVLRVARTIADLEGSALITETALDEAMTHALHGHLVLEQV